MRALLVALALLAAACGDTGSVPTTATSTMPPTSLPAPTATAPSSTAPPPTTMPSTSTPATTTLPPATTVPPTTTAPGSGEVALTLELAADGAGRAVFVTAPPGDERLFVVDQAGRILVVRGGAVLAEPFLDIASLVRFDGEQGLLGMAFHPRYPDDPRFFVNYTDIDGTTRVVSYRVSDDPDLADSGSAAEIIAIDQPAPNHNGGMVAFGPDGYLYVGMGDGGSSADRFGNGQRPDTLLGTILRLDVDGGEPYAIPPDNPFASGGGAPEVWLYGLRNPWRFSFDGATVYIGDVGQNRFEEIDVVGLASGGANLGWPIMEGAACFQPASDCRTAGLTLPAHTYLHGPGCSITGGYVYRGVAIPALQGHYFYGDFCSGRISSLRVVDGIAVDQREWTDQLGTVAALTSFGVGGDGELYVVSGRGDIFRLAQA